MQFIIEAVVQTSIGGMLGMAVGLALVFGIPFLGRIFFGKVLPVQLDVASIFLSLAVAVGVGVLFGWYPARRASMLDPIEALRHN
jgi:putative ABC transport system permease protein